MRQCKKCQSTAFRLENKTFSNGTEHIARYCLQCGKFLDYARKELPPGMFPMPVGRHKGKHLQWVVENDFPYALWVARQFEKKSVRERMQEVLADLDK